LDPVFSDRQGSQPINTQLNMPRQRGYCWAQHYLTDKALNLLIPN